MHCRPCAHPGLFAGRGVRARDGQAAAAVLAAAGRTHQQRAPPVVRAEVRDELRVVALGHPQILVALAGKKPLFSAIRCSVEVSCITRF